MGVSRSQKDGKPQLLPPRLCSACPLQAISLAPHGNLNHIPPLHKATDVSARNHWPRKNCSGHRLPLPCSVLIPSQTCCPCFSDPGPWHMHFCCFHSEARSVPLDSLPLCSEHTSCFPASLANLSSKTHGKALLPLVLQDTKAEQGRHRNV